MPQENTPPKPKLSEAEGGAAAPKRERRHVHEQVFGHMRRGLMIGAFVPGQVMSLRKLAASFGTSPMPVREVLSRLVAANALEEMPSGSARVPRLTPEKLGDLFSVREVVEGAAAELAGQHANGVLIGELEEINAHLLTAIDKRDIMGCLSLNQSFHFTLYRASRSDVIMPLIESLWLQFGPTMYMSLLIPSMPWNASDHETILASLREGNGTSVKRGIVSDIRNTRKALLSLAGTDGIAELPFNSRSSLSMDY